MSAGMEITVHIRESVGRCFKVTRAALSKAADFIDSENVLTIDCNTEHIDEVHCFCGEEMYKKGDAHAEYKDPSICVHCKGVPCFWIPASKGNAYSILEEVLDNPNLCFINVWCRGFFQYPNDECQCIAETTEFMIALFKSSRGER